jgi:quinol monooxygenase YgiN
LIEYWTTLFVFKIVSDALRAAPRRTRGFWMFDRIVTQRVTPGREAEFEALVRRLEAATLENDEGCVRYEWYRADIPQTFTLIERWRDGEAAAAHLRAPHVLAILPKLRDCSTEWFTVTNLERL